MYLPLNVVILWSVSAAVGQWTWVEENNLVADMEKEIDDVKIFASVRMSVAKIKKYIKYTVKNEKTLVETLYESTLVAYGWNKTRRGAVLKIEGTKGIRYFGLMYSATKEETTFEIEPEDNSDRDSEEDQEKVALLEAHRKEKVANNMDTTSTPAPSPSSSTPTSTTAPSPKTVGSKENDMVKSIAFTRRVNGKNSAKFRVEYPLVTKTGKVLAVPFTLAWKIVKNTVVGFFFPIACCIKDEMDIGTFLFFTFVIPVIPATCIGFAAGGAVVGAVEGVIEGPRAAGREFGNNVEFDTPLAVKKRPQIMKNSTSR